MNTIHPSSAAWQNLTHRPVRHWLAMLLCALPLLAHAGVGSLQEMKGMVLLGLNGQDRPVEAFAGRPLLINVWASWCGPCRAEMGSLERLAWTPTGEQLAIIGISTDDRKTDATRLLQVTNATLSHYIDKDLQFERALDASRIPVTVLFDAKGRVVGKYYGSRDWASAESQRLIQGALKGTKSR